MAYRPPRFYNVEMSGHTPVSNIQPHAIFRTLSESGKVIKQEDLKMGKVVNQGDVGKVHLATYMGRTVACKQVKGLEGNRGSNRDISASSGKVYDQAVTDIMREVAALSTLRPHPNIVKFVGMVDAQEMRNPVIVEEYLDGISLKAFLDGGLSCGQRGPLPDVTVWAWIMQLFKGLASIHENDPMVIHRDLKPANIMLTEGLNVLVITDFGAAKRIPKAEKDAIQMHQLGNRMYMAPEVLQTGREGTSHYDEKCDVYSAGLLSWRIATRQPITRSPAMHNHFPDISEVRLQGLRPLIHQCWSLNPADRPSAKVAISMLEHLPDKPEVGVNADGVYVCAPPQGCLCTVS
mmetsp:Transcript_5628/g.13005  ORF Transcript_5628/g.13005 Transcript_5628/m.13005 type:complete len:348 (-) Transcript_5628:220-1263(-)